MPRTRKRGPMSDVVITEGTFEVESVDVFNIATDVAELQAFKAEWEPVLVMLMPAICSIAAMVPPGMLPPQVKSLVDKVLGK